MILLTLITAAVKTKCTTIHGNCMAFEYLLVATATFFLISAVDFFFVITRLQNVSLWPPFRLNEML